MTRAFLLLLLAMLAPGLAQAQPGFYFVINSRNGDIMHVSPAGVSTRYAHLDQVEGLGAIGFAMGKNGNLFVSAPENGGSNPYAIFQVDTTGKVSKLVGGFPQLGMMTVAPNGTIFTASINKLYKISPLGGAVTTLSTTIAGPTCMTFDTSGRLYVSDASTGTIDQVNPNTGDAKPYATGINHPEGLAFDTSGNLYVADIYTNTVQRVSTTGVVTLVAQMPLPRSLAFDAKGNLYITSESANAVYIMDKSESFRQASSGFNMPLNIAFTQDPPGGIALTAVPPVKFPVGLMIACLIPAILLLATIIAWLMLRNKNQPSEDVPSRKTAENSSGSM